MEIKNLFAELETNIPDDSYHAKNLIGNKKLIVYGAGNDFTQFRMNVLDRCGIVISVIIDRKFAPGSFYGTGPCHPDDYKPSQDDLDNAVALICLGNTQAFREATNYLNVKGFKNIIKSHDVYDHFCVLHNNPDIERDSSAYYKFYRDEIDFAYHMMGDDISKEIYLSFMRSFLFKKLTAITFDENQEQYFPTDLPFNVNFKRWINCGAWQGDTIDACETFYCKRPNADKPQAIFCFEPDFENYNMLLYNINKYSDNKKKITAFPFGLWSDNTILKFRSGISKACRLLAEGDRQMQCVALDKMNIDFRPTYINMDIEGAELEALKGAKEMIKKYKPDLAICVYHSPNHIWEIPAYLKSLGCGYEFYLRNHTGHVVETVLYATTRPLEQKI